MINVMRVVSFLVIEQGVARGALDEVLRHRVPLLLGVLPLQVLLQVELDDVLGAAQVAVVDGLGLVGVVDLDLLGRRRCRHGFEQGHDSLVGGLDVVALGSHVVEHDAAVGTRERTHA